MLKQITNFAYKICSDKKLEIFSNIFYVFITTVVILSQFFNVCKSLLKLFVLNFVDSISRDIYASKWLLGSR